MKYKTQKVARSPEVEELQLDYGWSAPDLQPTWDFSTEFGAAQVEGEPVRYRGTADVLRDQQFFDEPTEDNLTRVEQGWIQGEAARLGVETDQDEEEFLSYALDRAIDPSKPALPTDYFEQYRRPAVDPIPVTEQVTPAPSPHRGNMTVDSLITFGGRTAGELIPPPEDRRTPATIGDMIQELQTRIRFGSDFDPTPQHLTDKVLLEQLKRIGQTPEQTSPVVRALGPGLGGPGILLDLPAWSGPAKGAPPPQKIKPIGRR